MTLNLQIDFPHVAQLYYNRECRSDQFRGSGILLGPRHILTCAHVAEKLSEHRAAPNWFVKEANGAIVKVLKGMFSRDADRKEDRALIDLAVFELDLQDIEGQPRQTRSKPVMILKRVTYQFLKTTLEITEILAAGGVDLGTTDPYGPLIRPPRALDGRPVDFQCAGGIADGFSGGPVVMHQGHEWVCVGVNWYGGLGAGHSRFLTGDTVHRFLSQHHPELLDEPGVRFVDLVLTQTAVEAECRTVLRAYNRRCRDDWQREKPQPFIAPRLAIRKTESEVLDRSAVDRIDHAQQHVPLLSDDEKKQSGKGLAVEQYRRLFEKQPEKATSRKAATRARLCVTEDAGSGKSVFTRHLQSVMASKEGQQAFFDGEPGLVVRWEGREKSWPFDVRGDLKNALTGLCDDRSVTAEQVVDFAIQHRRVCLILDALDQVTDYLTPQGTLIDRSLLLDKIFSFLKSDEGLNCHVVITGRSYAVTQEGDGRRFPHHEWMFATLEGFDERQQRRYLREFLSGREWKDFLPCHAEMAELLQVPVILSLIAEIGGDIARARHQPRNHAVLEHLQNRGDVYLRAHEKLAERAAANLDSVSDSDLARWELILAAAAFAMMCDKMQRRNYAVVGTHAVANLRQATRRWARQVAGEPLSAEDQIKPNDWDTLTLFSQLTKHKSVEKSSPSILSWKHRGWMEYFAGLYLARYASVEAAEEAAKFSNDADWFWTWRFAIEANLEVAISDLRSRSISGLFRRPTSGRRPNELIYRACTMLQSTNQECNALDRFDSEFRELLNASDAKIRVRAREIDSGFKRCPKEPTFDRVPFRMGAPDSDLEARSNEKPQIEMKVDPFWMSATPTTKGQYWLYDPGHGDDPAFADRLQQYSPTADCPVIFVTWYDAWCYARWCESRLPTEVEWEYACRAGTTSRYWWGDEMDESRCTFRKGSTTPASPTHANPWDLMDMSGNVDEWCETWYAAELARLGDSEFTSEFRVFRGGSFYDYNPQWLRSSIRVRDSPDLRDFNIGFRVSRTRNSL